MIRKLHPRNIHRTPNINITGHIPSSELGTFIIMDYRIGHSASFDKCQITDTIYSIFSDLSGKKPSHVRQNSDQRNTNV